MQVCLCCSAAPGGANDIAAFSKTGLSQIIQNLPPRKFVVGDNAYVCSETLLTPFSGVEKEDPAKDVFYFYLSQLRICTAQTFRLMTGNGEFYVNHFKHALKKLGTYS